MSRKLLLTRACLVSCVVALALVYRDIIRVVRESGLAPLELLQGIVVAVLVTALVYGSLVYLLARCGYLRRQSETAHRSLDTLESAYEARRHIPRVCVLIPSYKEEPRVLRQTILSAALSKYPSRRIVVLVDDPPPVRPHDVTALEATRRLVSGIHHHFHVAATRFQSEYSTFLLRVQGSVCRDIGAERNRVARLYEELADWVEGLPAIGAPIVTVPDHSDDFLFEKVIAAAARDHRCRAMRLRERDLDLRQVDQAFRRLVAFVKVDVASFERKQFHNLSHAPNKAMNLNSYIGLMGRSFRIVTEAGARMLQECPSSSADLIIPEDDYLLTLDADSVVLPEYLLKLVDIMERDDRIAVAQTPYSAVPGSRNPLERAAGAQTDLQYIVHQGFTASNATFWVGANALLRLVALRDIQTAAHERGHVVPVFIQDRTVIEDTGSTMDLVQRGWRLHNHPERLAYSATPADFGSLIIQRRRWSNGGLIILADLIRYARGRKSLRPSAMELFMRAHYLCGPAITVFSVLLLLVLPLDGNLLSAWLPATVLPYYVVYARDARLLRYRWTELIHVYTLSLMLLPIVLAGVLRSIQQMITGRKSAFGRTPKVEDRTPTEPLHVALQIGLALTIAIVAGRHALEGRHYWGLFWAVNCLLLVAGIGSFIGLRHAFDDLCSAFRWPRIALPFRHRRLELVKNGPVSIQHAEHARKVL